LAGSSVALGAPTGSGKSVTQTADLDAVLGTGNYFAEFIQSPVNSTTDPFSGEFSISAAAPEPCTWAMMILGFFGIGFVAYRRRAPGRPFASHKPLTKTAIRKGRLRAAFFVITNGNAAKTLGN
jgi:hypothetical protein